MAITTSTVNKQSQQQKAEQQRIICRDCKKPGHAIEESRKRIGKEQESAGENEATEKPKPKRYLPCPYCRRTNHTADVRWKGSSAANRPKRQKTKNSSDSTDDSHNSGTSIQNALTSILKTPLK